MRRLREDIKPGRFGQDTRHITGLRPMTLAMLRRLMRQFGIEARFFSDEDDLRLASELRESAGDPLLLGSAVSVRDAHAAVRASPEIAKRFLRLHRAYLALDEEHRALQASLAHHDPSPASRFPYDEVRDWVQSTEITFTCST